jgi:predicted Zn-dependent protease
MRQLPAKDGGHTAFTDHRIARPSTADSPAALPDTITAWREPERPVRERNLALALVAIGLQNESTAEVIRGYRMLNRSEGNFPNDPALLTSLGVVLLKGKQPAEALKRFEKVVELQPGYAPYHVNMARALLGTNHTPEAARELEKALALDALFQPAVELLSDVYRGQGQIEKANDLTTKYEQAMGISRH